MIVFLSLVSESVFDASKVLENMKCLKKTDP